MSGKEYEDQWIKYPIKDFGGGLNIGDTEVQYNELTIAKNMELVSRGASINRDGYRQCNPDDAVTGTYVSSIYQLNRRESGSMVSHLMGSYDGKIFKATVDASDKLLITAIAEPTQPSLSTSQFRWATLANKAVIVSSDNVCLWTDGTTVYNLGIAKPSAPTAVKNATGTMAEGTYLVGYSYQRTGDFGYETNVSASTSVTVDADDSIDISVVASTDAQVDKIRIFCSTLNGSVLYWVEDVNNTTATVNIDYPNASGYEAPTTYAVPPKAKFCLVKDDRLIIANTNDDEVGSCTVRWSAKNQPDTFYNTSFEVFDAEDGDEITGMSTVLNYVVLFKNNKIYMIDAFSLNDSGTQLGIIEVSNKYGCVAPDSIQSVLNGRAVVYQSDEGVILFDGKENTNISDNKIETIFDGQVNKTKWDEVRSVYFPTKQRYSIMYPSGTSSSVWYNFHFKANGWSKWDIGFPKTFAVVKSEEEDTKVLFSIGKYIYELDYGNEDNGEAITWDIKTIAHTLAQEMSTATKVIRRAYVDWYCSSAQTATFSVESDFGTKKGMSKTIRHGGSTDWGSFLWGTGTWGLSGREIDRVNLSSTGKSFMFRLSGSGKNKVRIYNFDIHYYPISLGGVVDD